MKNLNDFSELAKTKKILVTGAGGLVGSSFIDFLEEIDPSANIIALGRDKQALEQRFKKYLDKSGFKLYQSDVCDMHEDFSVDYIIHAASPAHPLAYSHNPVEVMKANLVGTINMLEIAKKSKARLLSFQAAKFTAQQAKQTRLSKKMNTAKPIYFRRVRAIPKASAP